jgi:hypothetical protein
MHAFNNVYIFLKYIFYVRPSLVPQQIDNVRGVDKIEGGCPKI